MKYPTGSYITKDGERRKILGEAGEIRFVSHQNLHGYYAYTISVEAMEATGWVEEAKQPPTISQAARDEIMDFLSKNSIVGFGKKLDSMTKENL